MPGLIISTGIGFPWSYETIGYWMRRVVMSECVVAYRRAWGLSVCA